MIALAKAGRCVEGGNEGACARADVAHLSAGTNLEQLEKETRGERASGPEAAREVVGKTEQLVGERERLFKQVLPKPEEEAARSLACQVRERERERV